MVPRPATLKIVSECHVCSQGVFGNLQACFLFSLFSWEVLVGDSSGLSFYSCVLSLVIIVLVSLKVFQLVFWVSRVHLGNGIVPCVGT